MKSIKLTDSFDIVSFLIIMKKQAVTQQNFHQLMPCSKFIRKPLVSNCLITAKA